MPEIRAQHPAKQSSIAGPEYSDLPPGTPTHYRPGSLEKVTKVMAERVMQGLPACNPDDADHEGDGVPLVDLATYAPEEFDAAMSWRNTDGTDGSSIPPSLKRCKRRVDRPRKMVTKQENLL